MSDIGDTVGQVYQLKKQIGDGITAKTYLAQDLNNSHGSSLVVVKQQKKNVQSKKRFDNEAVVLEKLDNHPQIPKLLATFEENGEVYLVEEYIAGQNLEEEVKVNKFKEEAALQLLEDVLNILDYVHRKQVIHRDVSPRNLIRDKNNNRFVLVDFGSIKEIPKSAENQPVFTRVIGTAAYMAPEQYNSQPCYSSDLYSLGRTTIYALTAQDLLKLENRTTGELEKWEEYTKISARLTAILDKMIRPKLTERYSCAADVIYDLQSLLKIGKTLGGSYKITKYIGRETWGHIYQADNIRRPYQSPCIIKTIKLNKKLLPQDFNTQLTKKFKLLEKLGKKDIIPQLWDHFENKGELYIVEEFIKGDSLTTLFKKGRHFDENQVINLLENILLILSDLHQEKIIHASLKPAYIIKKKDGEKYVLTGLLGVRFLVQYLNRDNKTTSAFESQDLPYSPPEQMAQRLT